MGNWSFHSAAECVYAVSLGRASPAWASLASLYSRHSRGGGSGALARFFARRRKRIDSGGGRGRCEWTDASLRQRHRSRCSLCRPARGVFGQERIAEAKRPRESMYFVWCSGTSQLSSSRFRRLHIWIDFLRGCLFMWI